MSEPIYFTDGDETVQNISAVPCSLHSIHLVNGDAGVRYVQIFDAAAGDVTLGTTVPDMVIPMGSSATVHLTFYKSVGFKTACSFACTTTATGSTPVTVDTFVGATIT